MKEYILKRPVLSVIALLLFKIRYLFFNSYQIIGRGNRINKTFFVLFKRVKVKINGHNNHIFIGNGSRFKNVIFEISGNNNKILINDDVFFYERGHFLIVGNNVDISIGKDSTFGSVDLFAGESNTRIDIGENCMFSRNISVATSDFHSIIDIETGERINKPADIKIGNHVWVGYSAYIYQGASISDDSVISAKAFVNKSFNSGNVVIAGIPAKVVKEGITWSREKL